MEWFRLLILLEFHRKIVVY